MPSDKAVHTLSFEYHMWYRQNHLYHNGYSTQRDGHRMTIRLKGPSKK